MVTETKETEVASDTVNQSDNEISTEVVTETKETEIASDTVNQQDSSSPMDESTANGSEETVTTVKPRLRRKKKKAPNAQVAFAQKALSDHRAETGKKKKKKTAQ